MKTFGARIVCCICNAQPWPDDPATTRQTFDLRLSDGSWYCELHRPPKAKAKAPRTAPAPTVALNDFENLFETEFARIAEVFDDREDVETEDALKTFREGIARGLTELGKAIKPKSRAKASDKSGSPMTLDGDAEEQTSLVDGGEDGGDAS